MSLRRSLPSIAVIHRLGKSSSDQRGCSRAVLVARLLALPCRHCPPPFSSFHGSCSVADHPLPTTRRWAEGRGGRVLFLFLGRVVACMASLRRGDSRRRGCSHRRRAKNGGQRERIGKDQAKLSLAYRLSCPRNGKATPPGDRVAGRQPQLTPQGPSPPPPPSPPGNSPIFEKERRGRPTGKVQCRRHWGGGGGCCIV